MEEPIGCESDDDGALTLHDVLSAQIDDPASAASRNIDWERLIESLDQVCKEILRCLSEGIPLTELKAKLKRSRSSIQAHKERLAGLVRAHLGADVLVQARSAPVGVTTSKPTGNERPAVASGSRRRESKGVMPQGWLSF